MNQFKKLFLLIPLIGSFGIQHVSADNSDQVGFSVSANLPDNQINTQNTFFDLKINPNQKETISVTVFNSSDGTIRIKNEIHDAYTSQTGIIDYVKNAGNYDKTIKYPLSNVTSQVSNRIIDIPAHSSQKVSATITMPDTKQFNGVILGGWYFSKVNDITKNLKNRNVSITNDYSYVIGLKYTVGHEIKPKIVLNNVYPGLYNSYGAVLLNIQNPTPAIVSNLNYSINIYKIGSEKVFLSKKMTNGSIAPNSNFNFPIIYGNKTISPGKYVAKVVVENKKYRWALSKKFTITKQEVNRINKESMDSHVNNNFFYMIIGLLILIMTYLIYRLSRYRALLK